MNLNTVGHDKVWYLFTNKGDMIESYLLSILRNARGNQEVQLIKLLHEKHMQAFKNSQAYVKSWYANLTRRKIRNIKADLEGTTLTHDCCIQQRLTWISGILKSGGWMAL